MFNSAAQNLGGEKARSFLEIACNLSARARCIEDIHLHGEDRNSCVVMWLTASAAGAKDAILVFCTNAMCLLEFRVTVSGYERQTKHIHNGSLVNL